MRWRSPPVTASPTPVTEFVAARAHSPRVCCPRHVAEAAAGKVHRASPSRPAASMKMPPAESREASSSQPAATARFALQRDSIAVVWRRERSAAHAPPATRPVRRPPRGRSPTARRVETSRAPASTRMLSNIREAYAERLREMARARHSHRYAGRRVLLPSSSLARPGPNGNPQPPQPA